MMPDHAMTTAPQGLEALVERYMDSQPQCLLCREAPGVMPLVYIADTREGHRVRGCCFAVCVFCWLGDNFQARIAQALRKARVQEQGAWN
jgi:hypothetical protein